MTGVQRIAPGTIRIERLLHAPRDTVWRYLVEAELRKQWFAGGEMEQRTGGSVDLIFDHDNLSADDVPYPEHYCRWKGAVGHETIVEYDPPRVLAISWDEGREGVARFELFEAGGETRLVLTHSGITGPAPMANFASGWHSHLAVLEGLLSGDRVRDFWALHAESEAEVAQALAK